MKPSERKEAAQLIRDHICISERFELKLPCGMVVRCDNNKEAREALARRFEKAKTYPNFQSKLKTHSGLRK